MTLGRIAFLGSGETSLAGGRIFEENEIDEQDEDARKLWYDEVYEGWDVVAGSPDRLAAFAALATRLSTWLLDPWSQDRPGRHPVWDWYAGGWGATVEVPPTPVVVLEGVGLASRGLRARSVLSVWVDADADVRLPRVLARDGEALRDHMLSWQRDERAWHVADRTAEECDVVVTT